MKFFKPIFVLLCMALPASAETLVGSWVCKDLSGTATVTDAHIFFMEDGESTTKVWATEKLGAVVFDLEVHMTGNWVLNGAELTSVLSTLDVTRLMFGTKDMTASRSADDLRALLMREYAKDDNPPAIITFDGADHMVMTEPELTMDCIRKGPRPIG